MDASVFLNGFNPYEPDHEENRHFLEGLREQAIPIIAPTLLLPEVAAAINRGRDDAELARRFNAALRQLPHLVVVGLDETLAGQAADVAAQNRLCGSDAVYAAVALRFSSALVTLGKERRDRMGGVVSACFPSEAL